MYLYLIYIVFAVFSFIEINGGRLISKRLLFVPFLCLFFLSCLRWERGTDWNSYLSLFEEAHNAFYLLAFEPGFYYLNLFVKINTDNYTILLMVEAFIIYALHFYVIKRYSISPMVSVLIWFGFYMGSIFFVRFHIALAITLFSFIYIMDRKFWKFLICIFIATLFHRTAFLFIPAYFIYTKNFSRLQLLFGVGISFCLSALFKLGLDLLGGINLGTFSEKALVYSESDAQDFGISSPFRIMLIGATYRVLIILLIIRYFYTLYKENNTFKGLLNLYFVGVCLFIVITPVSIPMARMAQYYEYIQLLIVPYIILNFRHLPIRNLVFIMITLFYLMRLKSNIGAYEDLFIPYKSIFNKDMPVEIG